MQRISGRLGGAFGRYWASETISHTGTQVTVLALPTIAVLTLRSDPFAVGLLAAAARLPFPVLALVAGGIVDRLPRRALMVVCDVLSTLVLLSIPVAHATGHLSMALLVVVALLAGTLSVFFDVASLAVVADLVPHERLFAANTRSQFGISFAMLAGPGLGGLLIGLVGAPNAVFADSLSFLLGAALLFGIRVPPRLSSAAPRKHLGREITEGLRYVGSKPPLWSLILVGTVGGIGHSAADAILPLVGYRALHFTPTQLGLLLTLLGVGGFFGAAVAQRVFARIGVGPAIGWGWALSGVCVGALPLGIILPPLLVLPPLFLVAGALNTVAEVGQVGMRQSITPPRLQGRMNATFRTAFWTAWPVGNLLGGIAATFTGVTTAYLGAAAAGVAGAALTWFVPLRRVRDVAVVHDREPLQEAPAALSVPPPHG